MHTYTYTPIQVLEWAEHIDHLAQSISILFCEVGSVTESEAQKFH